MYPTTPVAKIVCMNSLFSTIQEKKCSSCGSLKVKAKLDLHNSSSYYYYCNGCKKKESFKLPKSRKKLIYLDQFALSNMAFVTEKSSPKYLKLNNKERQYWSQLYNNLLELVQLQLIACPITIIHRDESLLSSSREDIKVVLKNLSLNYFSNSPLQVRNIQIKYIFLEWLKKNIEAYNFDFKQSHVIDPSVHDWLSNSTGLVVGSMSNEQKIRQQKSVFKNMLQRLCEEQRNSKISFQVTDSTIKNFITDYCQNIWVETKKYLKDCKDFGLIPPPPEISIITELVLILSNAGLSEAMIDHCIKSFLSSEAIFLVPYWQIMSELTSAIIQKYSQPNCKKKLGEGIIYDMQFISAYLPYYNAFYLDNEMYELLNTKYLSERKIKYNTLVFAKKCKSDFEEYLKSIMFKSNKKNIELAKELYSGSNLFSNLTTHMN